MSTEKDIDQRQDSVEAALQKIAGLVTASRERAFRQANTELIDLYWRIGQYLAQQCRQSGWGQGTVRQLAGLIQQRHPDWRGFSASNLWRMKQCVEMYQGNEALAPLVRLLGWTHNLLILGKCKTQEERGFYLKLAAEQGWGKRELKVGEFEPEHLGKLGFYLEALDRDHRKPHEAPSIGVLLCKTRDHDVVEYALSRSLSPTLIAEYQTRLPDKALLQAKLDEFYELAQREEPPPSDE